MAHRWLAGIITDRELVRWAHITITHQGATAAQCLVTHDDLLDMLPFRDMDETTAHHALADIVMELPVPDPWADNSANP